MEKNKITVLGAVASVVGGLITLIGLKRYSDSKSMWKTSQAGDELFGTFSKSTSIWEGKTEDAKLLLIIGAVILVIGIIILVAGIISERNVTYNISSKNETSNTGSSMDKLKELKELMEEGYISSDEYEKKRKELLDL